MLVLAVLVELHLVTDGSVWVESPCREQVEHPDEDVGQFGRYAVGLQHPVAYQRLQVLLVPLGYLVRDDSPEVERVLEALPSLGCIFRDDIRIRVEDAEVGLVWLAP